VSYKNTIDANLKRAFSMIKDLATDAILNKKQSSSFDFSTGDSVNTGNTVLVVKAILINSKKASTTSETVSKEVMLKSKEVIDISAYDTLTINSEVWKIGPVISNDGFLILATVFREV